MKTFLLGVLLVSATTSAFAQPADPVLGEQLFKEGRELAKHDRWAAACPKFEASLRADPTLGTRLNLATCYEKTGKLASAWQLYRESAEAADKAGDRKRRDYANTQAAAIEPKLPRLTITAPAAAPVGFTVTRDGAPVSAGALGQSLFLDPGTHDVVATAPGFQTITRTVEVKPGSNETLALPTLEAAPTVAPVPITHEETAKRFPPRTTERSRSYLGLGIAAGGVAVAGVGLYFGVKAKSTYGDAKDLCGDDLTCSDADYAHGQALIHDARKQATLSTVLVAVGGAAVVTGVVLYVISPHGKRAEVARVTPTVAPTSVGLAVGGSF